MAVSKAVANRAFTTCPECRTMIRRRSIIWLWISEDDQRVWLHQACWSVRLDAQREAESVGVGILTDLENVDIEWETYLD